MTFWLTLVNIKNMKKRFLSTGELAKLLGISRVAVYKKIKKGKIDAFKVGNRYVISRRALDNLLGKNLTTKQKRIVESAVKKVVSDYGETLRLLGRE